MRYFSPDSFADNRRGGVRCRLGNRISTRRIGIIMNKRRAIGFVAIVVIAFAVFMKSPEPGCRLISEALGPTTPSSDAVLEPI